LQKIPFLLIVLNFLSYICSLQFFQVSGFGEAWSKIGDSAIVFCAKILPADSKACPPVCFDGHLGIVIRSLSLESGIRIFPEESGRDVM
jgi:hypothetical protein